MSIICCEGKAGEAGLGPVNMHPDSQLMCCVQSCMHSGRIPCSEPLVYMVHWTPQLCSGERGAGQFQIEWEL